MPKKMYLQAIGRRKTASASVRLFKTGGEYKINKKDLKEYFADIKNAEQVILHPFELCGCLGKYSLSAFVKGGGKKAQLEAIQLGISRILASVNEAYLQTLRKAGLLTRDPREKERKKPGLKRARRAPQWQKR